MVSLLYFACIVFLFACVDCRKEYSKEEYCPVSVKNGDWTLNYKDGHRCILRCTDGFEPTDCNVIRRDKNGEWNRDVPTCVKCQILSGKTVAAVGLGVAAIVGGPYAIAAAGLGALTAWLQGSTEGSIITATQATTKYFNGCESE